MSKDMKMLRYFLVGFILIFFSNCNSNAQNNGILTKDQLLEDLQQLKKILESNHPLLYRFTSKEQYDSLYEEAEKAFYNNMDIENAFLPPV